MLIRMTEFVRTQSRYQQERWQPVMLEVNDGMHEQKPNSGTDEQYYLFIRVLDATVSPRRKFLAMLDKYNTFKTVL